MAKIMNLVYLNENALEKTKIFSSEKFKTFNKLKKLKKFIFNLKRKFNSFKTNQLFHILNSKELEVLFDVIIEWYYFNNKFPNNFEKKYPEINKVIIKIKDFLIENQSKLPAYLYRGVAFESQKEMDQFFKLNKDILYGSNKKSRFSSWTSSLKIAKYFAPNGKWICDKCDYGGIMKIARKDYLNNIFFSLSFFFENNKTKKEFFEEVYKFAGKELKKIKNYNEKELKKYKGINAMFGAKLSFFEEEYILDSPKMSLIKFHQEFKKYEKIRKTKKDQ
jgi:hypothetical protein